MLKACGITTSSEVHPYLSLAQCEIVTFYICIAAAPTMRSIVKTKNQPQFPERINFPYTCHDIFRFPVSSSSFVSLPSPYTTTPYTTSFLIFYIYSSSLISFAIIFFSYLSSDATLPLSKVKILSQLTKYYV